MKIKLVPPPDSYRDGGTVYFYTMNMYFIAILCPEDINQQILKWKLWMRENHACEVALRSPAHITLIPPFWMKPELEDELKNSIGDFANGHHPFPIQLLGFSFFKPRVIFVDLVANEELTHLRADLQQELASGDKFPLAQDDRSFHPHVTIATRDLYKKSFYQAWEHFKEMKYQAQWITNGLSLLRHNKKNWDVIATSQFQ
jgi:2'-5' RNA ligase